MIKSDLVIDIYADDFERSRNFACVYCGNTTGLTRDHVIPVSWNGYKRTYKKGDTVKCCYECNNLLNSRPIHSISGRASYLAESLTKKYRKFLAHPTWQYDDLIDMSDKIKKAIISYENEKLFIQKRINHCILAALDDRPDLKVKQSNNDNVKLYKILNDLYYGHELSFIFNKYSINYDQLRSMFKTKNNQGIINIFKYENNIAFDRNLLKYFKLIRKNSISI